MLGKPPSGGFHPAGGVMPAGSGKDQYSSNMRAISFGSFVFVRASWRRRRAFWGLSVRPSMKPALLYCSTFGQTTPEPVREESTTAMPFWTASASAGSVWP